MLHSDNPIFRMDEGTVTLIRLVAPVKSAYDAMASMMLMPIIDVNLAYGDGRQWLHAQPQRRCLFCGWFSKRQYRVHNSGLRVNCLGYIC